MESYNDLIVRIREACVASAQNPSLLSYLLQQPIRKLLDYSGALAHLQLSQQSACLFAFNATPDFIRALRLAAYVVNSGEPIRHLNASDVRIVRACDLRAIRLGRYLRPLASGDFLVCVHLDTARRSRSTFAFIGAQLCDVERARSDLKAIAPYLHEALLNLSRSRLVRAPTLTPAEERVYCLLINGLSNKEIAKALNKSDSTIRNQLHVIFSKLGVGTRTEALAKQQKAILEPSRHKPSGRTLVVYD
jgi:DNA-binding CsgD family transcriptional regulator